MITKAESSEHHTDCHRLISFIVKKGILNQVSSQPPSKMDGGSISAQANIHSLAMTGNSIG
jgi:hypothetical protein